jgi:hypothetical protein
MNWIKNRIKERTTWDGVCLVVVGLIVLTLTSLAKIAAVISIGYGVWTILKAE